MSKSKVAKAAVMDMLKSGVTVADVISEMNDSAEVFEDQRVKERPQRLSDENYSLAMIEDAAELDEAEHFAEMGLSVF